MLGCVRCLSFFHPRLMPTLIVAWDIETCPFEINTFSPSEKRRYETELRVRQDRRPDEALDEASRLVRSVHPFLGWVCCISAVSGTIADGPNTPTTWTAASPEKEPGLLAEFWTAIEGFSGAVTWVTFNGKRFDAPFLSARSLRHVGSLAAPRNPACATRPLGHLPVQRSASRGPGPPLAPALPARGPLYLPGRELSENVDGWKRRSRGGPRGAP